MTATTANFDPAIAGRALGYGIFGTMRWEMLGDGFFVSLFVLATSRFSIGREGLSLCSAS